MEAARRARPAEPIRVLDLGCGCGVWGLILARMAPPGLVLEMVFADVDGAAAELSLRNAVANGLPKERCRGFGGDMLSALPDGADECAPFDLIVFNPPQTGGGEAFRAARPDKWGGDDGSLYYRRLVAEGVRWLRPVRVVGGACARARVCGGGAGEVAKAAARRTRAEAGQPRRGQTRGQGKGRERPHLARCSCRCAAPVFARWLTACPGVAADRTARWRWHRSDWRRRRA